VFDRPRRRRRGLDLPGHRLERSAALGGLPEGSLARRLARVALGLEPRDGGVLDAKRLVQRVEAVRMISAARRQSCSALRHWSRSALRPAILIGQMRNPSMRTVWTTSSRARAAQIGQPAGRGGRPTMPMPGQAGR
jgi:hypothetical protein